MYKFLDFILDGRQHALIQNNKKLDLGSTAYDLLLYFVKNPQATLTKDELINNVWQTKSVSESTLYKQVQRLRTSLGDTSEHKTIISTVHGVGFVFLPEVTELTKTQSPVINHEKKPKSRTKKIRLLAMAGFLLFSYFVIENSINEKPSQDIKVINHANAQPIRLAVISNLVIDSKTSSWMTNGGIHYLAESFEGDNVTIKRISDKDLKTEDANKYAINLSKNKKVKASIILDIAEDETEYTSAVTIRDDSHVIAEAEFNSGSIKNLLDEISRWSKKELQLPITTFNKMSTHSFAVENYIRGMAASTSGDDTNAIKYFELATMEDKSFWLAWYELAGSYAAIGKSQKALSVLKTLELTTSNPRNQIQILSAKTINYYQLDQYDLSLESVNEAIELAKVNSRDSDHSSLLTNKSMLLKVTGDYKAALKTVKESIALILNTKGDNFMDLCTAYNSLAGIHYQLYEYQKAIENSEKAVRNCQQTGNQSYLLNARTAYVQYLIKLGNYAKSRKIGLENLALEKQLNDKTDQIDSLLILTEIDIIEGLFDWAERNLQAVSELQEETNDYQKLYFTHKKIELSLVKQQLAIAELYLEQQEQLDKKHRYSLTRKRFLIEYHHQNKNSQLWKKEIKELTTDLDFSDNPFVYFYKAQLAIDEKQLDRAQVAFEKARELVLARNNSKDIAKILNPYIQYLIETQQINRAKRVLAQLEEHKPPNYPYLKTKAKLFHLMGNTINASSLMLEQKAKANDYWTSEDQLLLEKYQQSIN